MINQLQHWWLLNQLCMYPAIAFFHGKKMIACTKLKIIRWNNLLETPINSRHWLWLKLRKCIFFSVIFHLKVRQPEFQSKYPKLLLEKKDIFIYRVIKKKNCLKSFTYILISVSISAMYACMHIFILFLCLSIYLSIFLFVRFRIKLILFVSSFMLTWCSWQPKQIQKFKVLVCDLCSTSSLGFL